MSNHNLIMNNFPFYFNVKQYSNTLKMSTLQEYYLLLLFD